jgi:ribose/xylose/arabinose/galactoside ABC-type transport system permease subunit
MGDKSLAFTNGRPRAAVAVAGRNWALIFLLLLIVVFSFTGKNFLTLSNLQTVIYGCTFFLLLACAETFVIITGGVDLSVGYVMGLTSMAAAGVMRDLWASQFGIGWPAWAAILAGLVVGLAVCLACGFASGILVARFKVPPFIATLGVFGVAYGATLTIGNGPFAIEFLPPVIRTIGNGYLYYYNPTLHASHFFLAPPGTLDSQIKDLVRVFPNSLIFIVVFLAVLWYVLKHTRFGQHTYAIGGSMDAAIRAGIDTKKHLLMVYVLSAFLAGLAGFVDIFHSGNGNFVPIGANHEFVAITAVIIGGASLSGGKGRIMASALGVVILQVLQNGLTLSGAENSYRYVATGIILIAAVVIDQLFPDLFS